MNKDDRRKLRNAKRRIERRLEPRNWEATDRPVFATSNLRYDVADRIRALDAGGIGALHLLAQRVGLVNAIDESLNLLKRHLPYHESDHVLNIVYNVAAGNTRLEDLELLRHNESYANVLGTQRIPDPTTAGDFLRRLGEADIERLMDAVNALRTKIWSDRLPEIGTCAIIDLDGVVTPTAGEKKAGMSLSYKGIWGYHPLLVSLANTREPLFIVNRPGNVPSHSDSVRWTDKAIALCRGVFANVLLRGDTDFSLTTVFDRWTQEGVRFVFGYDAHKTLIQTADGLPATAFRPFVRTPKHEVKTEPRDKRDNAKDAVVRANEYENIRLLSEEIAEFPYRPTACKKTYRMIVLKKNLSMEKGDRVLFDDIRYFFYVTNDPSMAPEEVVRQANERCNQENLIEQLKNGVNALRVPVYDLVSNWAYMAIASLAWTLKAWFGLTLPRQADRLDILRMEFKAFLRTVMMVPCQVIRAARRITLRVLAYTSRVRLLFRSIEATAALVPS